MAYRIEDLQAGDSPSPQDPLQKWIQQLCTPGPLSARQRALASLIRLKAEPELVQCLKHPDPRTAQLATSGLWKIWLNEKGRKARQSIELGIAHLNQASFEEAETVFLDLMDQFPNWAEPINKQATLLYLRTQPALSLALCKQVLRLKPHHFGAWNGLALCASQLKERRQAISASTRAMHLQPHCPGTRQLHQSIVTECALLHIPIPKEPPPLE